MASRVQVLVAAMEEGGEQLAKRLGITTDALIGCQCDRNGEETVYIGDCRITTYYSTARGVGLNRNVTLSRATADFCLIADDDMRYYDGYADKLEKAFDDHPQADVIIFNVEEPKRKKPFVIEKPFRVGWLNFMRFATFRFAVRPAVIQEKGIFFNLHFGGGTEYAHGEDSIFLADCLRAGLHIIALPITLATLTYTRESTWFQGFNDKYFSDQGALYAAISRRHYRFLCLQDSVRHSKKYARHGGILKNHRMMIHGAKKYLNK